MGSNQTDPLQRIDIHRWVGKRIGISLDAVGQRVHTRVSRYLCGHGPRQFGIHVGCICNEERRHDAFLQMVALIE